MTSIKKSPAETGLQARTDAGLDEGLDPQHFVNGLRGGHK
jgi:hypothetical protein